MIVSMTGGQVDVVVEISELTDTNRAQIEDIVTRKTGCSIENLTITSITPAKDDTQAVSADSETEGETETVPETEEATAPAELPGEGYLFFYYNDFNRTSRLREDIQEDKVMAENTAAEKSYDCDENIGRIRISEQVVAVIAGIAATEVEGVESLVGNITNEIVAKMGIKNLSRGIRLKMVDDTVFVQITVNIRYGYSIPDISRNIQEKVSQAIENMTGLSVAEVNVIVSDVTVSKN